MDHGNSVKISCYSKKAVYSQSMDFEEALGIGRRKAFFFWKKESKNLLLSLDELLSVAPPTGANYRGIQEVPVDRIIGSENRSNDFAQGFYPLRSDMEDRWNRIRTLMLGDGIAEAVSLFEYGSMYFVRDGHHRVSVARTNGIDFITADVYQLNIPVSLPSEMTRRDIPLFQAKLDFYNSTHVFDFIPEDNFRIACPENWEFLKTEIFHYNRQWFIRKHGREPDHQELVENWNFMLYDSTMRHIKRNGLIHLFPGKQETDIFCDMIRLWNSYDDPDSKWFLEIYDMQIKKALRRRWYTALPMALMRLYNGYRMTAEDERKLFLRHTKLHNFYPDAVIPCGNKYWYRFLTDHVLRSFFLHNEEEKRPGSLS